MELAKESAPPRTEPHGRPSGPASLCIPVRATLNRSSYYTSIRRWSLYPAMQTDLGGSQGERVILSMDLFKRKFNIINRCTVSHTAYGIVPYEYCGD